MATGVTNASFLASENHVYSTLAIKKESRHGEQTLTPAIHYDKYRYSAAMCLLCCFVQYTLVSCTCIYNSQVSGQKYTVAQSGVRLCWDMPNKCCGIYIPGDPVATCVTNASFLASPQAHPLVSMRWLFDLCTRKNKRGESLVVLECQQLVAT